MPKITIAFILIFFLSFVANAQQFKAIHYHSDNGLHNSLTKSIVQDKNGYIWIATDDGFAKFDGYDFKVFNQNIPSILGKHLLQIKSGEIIAVTDFGVIEIRSTTDTVMLKTIIRGADTPSDSTLFYPKLVYETNDSTLWFSGYNAVYSYKNQKLIPFFFFMKNQSSSFHRAFSIVDDKQGNLFVISQPGFMYRFDTDKNTFVELTEVKQFPNVSHAYCVKKSEIWVATSYGLHLLKSTSNGSITENQKIGVNSFSFIASNSRNELYASSWSEGLMKINNSDGKYSLANVEGLPFNNVNSFSFDRENNIWLCTENGVVFLNQPYLSEMTHLVPGGYIQGIRSGGDNKILVSNGSGVYEIDINNNTSTLIYADAKGSVIQIFRQKNRIYVSTSAGDLIVMNENKKVIKYIDLKQYGRVAFFLNADNQDNIWICQDGFNGLLRLSPDDTITPYNAQNGNLTNRIIVTCFNEKGELYASSLTDTAYLFKYNKVSDSFENISLPISFPHNSGFAINDMIFNCEGLYLATTDGLWLYKTDSIQRVDLGMYSFSQIKSIAVDKNQNLWLGMNEGLVFFGTNNFCLFDSKDGLPVKEVTYRSLFVDSKNQLWVGTNSGLAFTLNNLKIQKTPTPFFKSIEFNEKEWTTETKIISGAYADIELVSLSFPSKDILYRSRIVGFQNEWTNGQKNNKIFIPSLKTGKYTVEVQALQHGNYKWSDTASFSFTVKPPIYFTWWAFFLYFIIALLLLWLIIRLYTFRLMKQKQRLENIVTQRTAEIEQQNQQIRHQAEVLQKAYSEIKQKQAALEETHQHIRSSINYAQRIQQAVLPQKDILEMLLPQHFVLFMPKDVVSGDFYLVKQIRNFTVIAVADCTGHGIPGGFLSMLGIAFINEIIHHAKHIEAAEVLEILRVRIKQSLQQTGQKGERQDGMDIALCVINLENYQLTFAGANSPLIILRNNELIEYKGNRMPVGIYVKERNFTQHSIQLASNDALYLFSDGYKSQFGGEENNTFQSKKFKKLIFDIHTHSMPRQRELLIEAFQTWKANQQQIDDVLVLGMKI